MEVAGRHFTVAECRQMAQAGILRESDRVGIVDGAIIQRRPMGCRHWAAVVRAGRLPMKQPADRAVVAIPSRNG
jgi:hypothetical protein